MRRQQKNAEKLKVFAARLRGAMSRAGLQANELAEKIGCAASAITNWRLGKNMAKGRNLRALAEALGCDAGWLSGLDQDADEPASHWQRRALQAEHTLSVLRAVLTQSDQTNSESDSAAALDIVQMADNAVGAKQPPRSQAAPPPAASSPHSNSPPFVSTPAQKKDSSC